MDLQHVVLQFDFVLVLAYCAYQALFGFTIENVIAHGQGYYNIIISIRSEKA